MAEQGNRQKCVVKLPHSVTAFFAALKHYGCPAMVAAGTFTRKSKFPLELQQIIHYSFPALSHGRPLNKVMIVLVGQAGAGKSTAINALFNDSVCKSGCSSSEARTVTEYGKELCVKDTSSVSVIGTLSFVDPPGALDVDASKEATNLAIITKFRDQNPDLRSRKNELQTSAFVREKVYPNLVLMVIHAAGAITNLRKCLSALEKYRLIDRLYPNLIIVVTHAMMLQLNSYRRETKLMTHIIHEAVSEILCLTKVQVVFVENNPDDYNLTKPQGFDFFQLPDGRLSHYNLITAMAKQFDKNGDILGKLLCGWYFSDECPEKQIMAAVLDSVEEAKLSDEETEEALQMLASIDKQLSAAGNIVPSRYDFKFLGRGYCPKTESPKNVTVYQETETTRHKLLSTLYTVPKCFEFYVENDDNHLLPISFFTKKKYECEKVHLYGLDNDVKLDVHVDSKARWVKGSSKSKDFIKRSVYEKRLMLAKLASSEISVKKELIEVLEELPASYSPYNVQCFQDFFDTHGSHFVHEVWIGGYVTFNIPIKAASYNEQICQEIDHKLRVALTKSFNLENKYSRTQEALNDKDIQNYNLVIEGGDPPQVTMLSELTEVRCSDWTETLNRYPVELPYSLKLCPYFTLIKNERRRNSLIQATMQYLTSTMPPHSPSPVLTPTKRQAMFFDDVGPNAMLVEAELRRYKKEDEERKSKLRGYQRESEEIQGNTLKRNEIGAIMVKKAQAEAKENNLHCVLL